MTSGKDALAKIKPNSVVDLRVQEADDFDEKDDLRTTRVLDITDSFVILEQPGRKIRPEGVGDSMGVTYVTQDQDGNLVREVLEVTLAKIGDFELKDGSTEALFFDYPSNAYSTNVRRHFRVEIPPHEDAFLTITDLDGRPIGGKKRYRIMDLSLQGLKFVCKKSVKTKDGVTADPVGRLSTNDEILTKVFIDKQEVVWTRSIIRIKLPPKSQESDALFFGIEFLQVVTTDYLGKKIEFRKYTGKDQQCIIPYITKLQREALRRERG